MEIVLVRTREQLAAILYRYANYKGYDTQRSVELAKFADRDDVGSYAVNAVKWAVADGLLSGVSATELQPKGFAIRAQVAAILMRFCEGAENPPQRLMRRNRRIPSLPDRAAAPSPGTRQTLVKARKNRMCRRRADLDCRSRA